MLNKEICWKCYLETQKPIFLGLAREDFEKNWRKCIPCYWHSNAKILNFNDPPPPKCPYALEHFVNDLGTP